MHTDRGVVVVFDPTRPRTPYKMLAARSTALSPRFMANLQQLARTHPRTLASIAARVEALVADGCLPPAAHILNGGAR